MNPPTDPILVTEGLPLSPGTVIGGKYRLENVLGMGGMGVIVAARHIRLDERFAIKVLLPEMAANPEVVERFLQEARASLRIRSEHVVRVVDVDTLESGVPYMVMEYLDGRDLETVIDADGPVSVTTAVVWLLQACEAIAEAHALGIVHRDLKPANVFLTHHADGAPWIKVLDFGISQMMPRLGQPSSRMTGAQAIMGSPDYMSPEQLRSTRDVDARTDVWSLGVLLHELLAGAPPFAGSTLPDLYAAILTDPPEPLLQLRPDVPQEVSMAVLRCLEKEPSARYDDVADLAAALAPFGGGPAADSARRILRVLRPATGDVVVSVPLARARGSQRTHHRIAGIASVAAVLAFFAAAALIVDRVGTGADEERAQAATAGAPAKGHRGGVLTAPAEVRVAPAVAFTSALAAPAARRNVRALGAPAPPPPAASAAPTTVPVPLDRPAALPVLDGARAEKHDLFEDRK